LNSDHENIWNRLKQAHLVQGIPPGLASLDSPWYIKLLLGISGWLAAIFLLGFLALVFEKAFQNTSVLILFGLFMIGGSFALLRLPQNEFFEHLALAVSFAGQALIIWATFDSMDDTTSFFIIALFQLILSLFIPNFVHRVLTSFFSALCFSIALSLSGIPYLANSIIFLAAAWLWLNEFSSPKHMRMIKAIAYGLTLGMIQLKGSAVFNVNTLGWRAENVDPSTWLQPWMAEMLTGLVALYVVSRILIQLGHKLTTPVALIAIASTCLVIVMSFKAQGLTLGLIVILLGFAGSNRVLMGLGIIALLFYISSYYYLLDATLLEKAQILLSFGFVLLLIRWLIKLLAIPLAGKKHE
jgi:hypothetical protein